MSTLKLYMPLNITTTDASGERFQLVGKGTLVCEEAVSTAIKQFDENGPDCGSRGRMSCFVRQLRRGQGLLPRYECGACGTGAVGRRGV